MEKQEYPCAAGDILYRIMDNCGGCEFETEVCQQRTCKHYRKYVERMTVQSVETRRSNGEDLFYVRGKEHGTDALFGWTAFRTEKEALARLDSFN
ncbi:MAG: hypothetical protein HFI10_14700 [Lachnospiraceae bacterium]|jgi:hypothetical protein|nr:hypothetical protein [Lachnospiraceae bacterium]